MRRLRILVIIPAVVLALAAPAFAAEGAGRLGHIVVLNGRTEVPEGKTAKDVVVFHGRTVIAGTVTGSVVVFSGTTTISGDVDDNVIVFHGTASVLDGAHIGGNLVTRDRPQVASGATVDGDIKKVSSFNLTGATFAFRYLAWLAFTVSTLLLGLLLVGLFPGPMESAARASQRTGAMIGWGIAALIGIPILAVIVTVTVVGIPLGLALLLGLWLLFTIGYTVGAFVVGRRVVKPPSGRIKAFLAGWGILRAIALIPFVGGLLWLVVTVVGLGSMIVAASESRRAFREADRGMVPAGGVPPPPPEPARGV